MKKEKEKNESEGQVELNEKDMIKFKKGMEKLTNSKEEPKSIRNLKITMNLLILALVCLSAAEFLLVNS